MTGFTNDNKIPLLAGTPYDDSVDNFVGIGLETSIRIWDVLYINRADQYQEKNIGAQIVIGQSTTNMSDNTALGTIADENSGRYAVTSPGIDTLAVAVYHALDSDGVA